MIAHLFVFGFIFLLTGAMLATPGNRTAVNKRF